MMLKILDEYGLYFAWLISLLAMGGSLYLSEVKHFVPCTLCWYQRILMYPLCLILGIASFRSDQTIRLYALPLSILGSLVALYHVLEQNIPGFGAAQLCSIGVPCATKYINWLGFISIPVLSLTGFVMISLLLSLRTKRV